MSHQSVTWALRQPVSHSPAKFVLVVLAHHAKADSSLPWRAFASVTLLAQQTGQDRKTVLANLKRLVDLGYLVDSGKREGGTGRVVIWNLCEPCSSPETGTVKSSQNRDHLIVPKSEPLNSTKNGTIETKPLVNSPNFGTSGKPEIVPVFPTEYIYKEVIPLSVGTDKDKSTVLAKKPSRGTRLPADWVLPKTWGDWALENRADLDRQGVLHLAEQFRDHWIALAGAKATKVDWAATWRNWVRNDLKFNGGRRHAQTAVMDADVLGTGI